MSRHCRPQQLRECSPERDAYGSSDKASQAVSDILKFANENPVFCADARDFGASGYYTNVCRNAVCRLCACEFIVLVLPAPGLNVVEISCTSNRRLSQTELTLLACVPDQTSNIVLLPYGSG